VNEVVRVDDTVGDFRDATVRFVPVAGTKGESPLIVRHQSGATVVVNDLIGNLQSAWGIMKLVLTLTGFAGSRPQVPRMFKKRALEDAGSCRETVPRMGGNSRPGQNCGFARVDHRGCPFSAASGIWLKSCPLGNDGF